MGLTLTRLAEWTSVQGGLGGKLENTALNTFILESILKFTDEYCSKNPNCVNIQFRQPFVWETNLKTQDLGSNYELINGKSVWHCKNKHFQAIVLSQDLSADSETSVIEVNCLDSIRTVLNAVGSKSLLELRKILKSNRDPVSKILGDRFSTVSGEDTSIYRYAEEIINSHEESSKTEDKKLVFKMSLDFHNFDMKLMQELLTRMNDTRLNPKLVESEFDLLLKFSGSHKEKCALVSIQPVPLYNFIHENGCRAPPWRQLHGEIAYFVIHLHVNTEICVTASSSGWFINNGPDNESLFTRKDNKTHPDLISLLKSENEHFSTFIESSHLKESYSQVHSDIRQSGDMGDNEDLKSVEEKDTDEAGKIKFNKKKTHHTSKTVTKVSHQDKVKVSKKWEILHINNVNQEEATRRLKYYESRKNEPFLSHNYEVSSMTKNNLRNAITLTQQNQSNISETKATENETSHSDNLNIKLEINTKVDNQKTVDQIDSCMKDWMTNNSMRVRRYSEIQESVRARYDNDEYTDIITRMRFTHENALKRAEKKKIDNRDHDNLSESSSESEEDEDTPDRRQETSDMSSEYWQIQKLVKYLKGGNQTSTIISLCALRDLPLHTENCQLAIRDVGGLEVLINLLETDEVRCKIGSLKILKEISHNPLIRRAIADLGGLNTMVNILKDPNRDLKCLSAETIANVAKFRRARRTVRHYGGIKKLVGLLDCPSLMSPTTSQSQIGDIERDIEVARCVALALWSCSKSKKNKEAMKKAGIISLLSKLLKSNHVNMLIPIVGTLQECASEKSYRMAIRTEGMIEDLVKNLKSSNRELEMHCAATIFKCAEEKEIRDLVRQYGGLEPLVGLLQQHDNKELLAAVTGAIWKCAISQENVKKFQELQTIEKLVSLLNDQPEEVLVNVVGGLGEMAKDPPNRAVIRKTGGITPLVNLLTGTNQALLVNTTKAVGRCAEEPDSMSIIDRQDGVRLLWSLLKNPNPEVQANAAWAICPCIENAKDAGEMVRSFVGGLELIVSLLKSEYIEVLASVCAAIGKIAMDEENLAVITDHGVVPLLARLTTTTDDILRCQLAEAISRCCNWGKNRIDFGKNGAVAPLVKYLCSNDEAVHRSTAKALFQLSKQPENCVTMHEAGVVKLLLGLVGSPDEQLQEAAASCIANIRRLALANEKSKQKMLKITN